MSKNGLVSLPRGSIAGSLYCMCAGSSLSGVPWYVFGLVLVQVNLLAFMIVVVVDMGDAMVYVVAAPIVG